jgi:hypothetical protein
VLAVAIACAVSAPVAATAAARPSGDLWAQLDRRCASLDAVFEPYHWPMRPFDRQHPVRGFFGDPRTFYSDLSGAPKATTPGLFSFHNGVDIYGRGGTKVYALVTGRVVRATVDEIVLAGPDRRRFQYWHLHPQVTSGERVVAYHSVVGLVRADFGHVHVTEMRGPCAVNPLAPGHLWPYHDRNRPFVLAIQVRSRAGDLLDPQRLRRPFELDAYAEDLPWPAVPGLWHGMPVTPTLVRWRLVGPGGITVVPERTAADFRVTIPPNSDFWQVYAADTHENFPELPFAESLERGRYIFRLTPPSHPLELPPGTYTVTVIATDTRGNSGSLSRQIVIRSGRV